MQVTPPALKWIRSLYNGCYRAAFPERRSPAGWFRALGLGRGQRLHWPWTAPVLAVGERNYDESAWLVAYVTRDEWLQQCQDELFKLRPHLSSNFPTTMASETGILTFR